MSGHQISDYFERFIVGKEPLETKLNELLHTVGCELIRQDSALPTERHFGFRAGIGESGHVIQKVAPGSPAAQVLSLNDKILAVDGVAPADDSVEGLFAQRTWTELMVLRQQMVKTVSLEAGEETYFPVYTIVQRSTPTFAEKEAFEAWLGSSW